MDKLKHNSVFSFSAIIIIYILAAFIGVCTYRVLDYPWWLSLLIADIAATVVTFIFSLIFGNASVYDPYWSVQPIIIMAAFWISGELNFFGVLLIVAIFFWGIRLTANWAYTFGDLSHQDWRYTMLKEKTSLFYPLINFIGIHMVPTLVVWACVLPAAYALINGLRANAMSLLSLLISLLAVIMQGTADYQMHKFRRHRDATFNRNGLWKYSRHPNYLGEILMWWGIAMAVVSAAPQQWYLMSGAAANTTLFLAASIPLADGRQSGKTGFDDYKKVTRMLLPIKK